MATQPKQPHYAGDIAEDPHTKKIEEIQREIDRLNEKASSEILEVEQRYNKLRKPLFDQRSKMTAAIPNFWPTVFRNHSAICACLTDHDMDVIKYLRNVEVQEFEDIKSGYRVTFTFDQNPYFSNTVLEKEFHVGENGQPTIKCSTISWFPDKDVTKFDVPEAGKKRDGPTESFFTWFTDDEEYGGDEIGDIIKDELWVSPIPYYLQADYEDDDDEGDDEDIIEDDEENVEEEDDYEEENDVEDEEVGEEDEDSKED